MRNLLTLFDLTGSEIQHIFAITEDLKSKYEVGLREPLLPGRVLALLFEKPSLRTRVSFEAAIAHLGGSSLLLGKEAGFGSRERIDDFARVLGQYVDALVVRAKRHETVETLAQHAPCSVINGLTDQFHPCQALADLYTLREVKGPLAGRQLVYVGDANNVARSLAIGCGKVGMKMVLASPAGYRFDDAFTARLATEVPELDLEVTDRPDEAVRRATAIYTDVWASMGQEQQRPQRCRDFAAFQVNAALLARAPRDACFMHCLPARRGEEVTDEVIDGPQSIVLRQAANRMHLQKGVLAWLLGAQT
ncbi:MAG: ornithine carbamoyltransferase [Planctomycetes bacterium RBG_16_64_10]|nr:MAG: ornithine carbamoyltransferase [Planctomycetes bacterium RBG_16_64_10]